MGPGVIGALSFPGRMTASSLRYRYEQHRVTVDTPSNLLPISSLYSFHNASVSSEKYPYN